MIQVKVATHPNPKNSLERITVETVNEMIKAVGTDMESRIGHYQCEHHPDQPSTLRISATQDHKLHFDTSGFCCQAFAKRVNIGNI